MSEPLLELRALREVEERNNNVLGDFTLMERAGFAAAKYISRLKKAPCRVTVLCGPGNNGGDGYVCAEALLAMDYSVTCVQVAGKEPKAGTPAETARKRYEQSGGLIIEDPYFSDKADVVVDALFGIGLSKPLSDLYLDAAQWFNERQAIHVSIDVPSGLDSVTGQWVGGVQGCVADHTLTFLAGKPGLFTARGPEVCGHVHTDNLGVSIPLSTINLIEPDDFRQVLSPRHPYSSKKDFGKVGIIGGGKGTIGAAVIAGCSALRMGAGAVYLELIEDHPSCIYPHPELMLKDELDLESMSVVVIGPGLGFSDKARECLVKAIEANVPLILDADALTMIGRDDALIDKVTHRQSHTVLTPHPGEASRLLRCTVKEIEADRVLHAQEISVLTGAVTVLKGSGTVIAQRSGKTWICPTGTPALATAGSGDALCGMIAAMFAQRYDFQTSVLAGVYLHGAASEGTDIGLLAGEIASRGVEELREMRKVVGEYGVAAASSLSLHKRAASHNFYK